MASILSGRKNSKIPKKTLQDHAEDALYREVNEEIHAEKTLEFVQKYSRQLIAAAIAILIIVIGFQLYRHNHGTALRRASEAYEQAAYYMDSGDFSAAATAFARASKVSSGAMADIALFQSAQADIKAKNDAAATAKLEQLAKNGNTRDWRDLAVLQLAAARGASMTAAELEKFMAPLQTKRSPYYFTGLLMVAEKYIAENDKAGAARWLDKIISDKDAPASIAGMAETLR